MVKKDVASSLTKEAIGLDVLNPKDDALFCMNIIDRYMKRPLVLEDCSLWRFAREWQTARKSQAVDRDSDNEDDDEEDHFAAENPRLRQETLLLLDGKTYIRKRTKDAVVKRYCIDQDKDPEGYAYSILLLFMPFRDEAELTVGFNCAVDAFIGNDSKLTDLETRERLEEISRALKKALESRAEKSADSRPLPQDPEIACADGGEEYGGVIEPYHDDRPIEERRASHEATLDSLQDRQRLAYQKVKDRVAEVAQNPDDNHPLRLFITGGGGTGKSYLLRAMSEIVDICLTTSGRKSFMIVAPTGVAAKNVGGTTLHRAFYLGVEKGGVAPYYALGGPKLESARDEWAAVKFLFVEEISMVSYQAFANIDTRLREVKEQDVPFGGLNVIAFGDLMQLPPVFGDWIFVQPRARLGEEHLWRLLDYVELDVNMRQKGDHRLRDLCNSIREGVVTEADISLLESRLLENLEASAFDDAIRIVPTVIEAQRYNASVLCKLDDELAAMNKRLYRIYAKDKMVSPDGREVEADPRFIPKKDKDCAGLPSCLIIGERCRVMLIRNLYLPSGLVNGSTGSVERIEWTRLQRSQGVVGDLPAGVWVRFDDPNSAKFPGAKDGLVFIEPVDVTYDTKAGRTFKRRMIPLILCYAVTVHKMQGVTVSKAVCRLGIEIFAKGQIYVALSRVTSLDGLAIEVLCKSKFLGDEKQRRKAILADDVAMAEMSRLRNLHSTPLNDEAHFSQEF